MIIRYPAKNKKNIESLITTIFVHFKILRLLILMETVSFTQLWNDLIYIEIAKEDLHLIFILRGRF